MKILFPTDGSECAERAARFVAGTLHKQTKGLSVTLLYVDEPMMDRVVRGLGEETVARIHRENSESALKAAHKRLKKAGVSFAEELRVGSVAACIAQAAEKGRYDLVVMGSHGRGTLGNLFVGSVTAKVLAQCKVPVLVVH